MNLKNYLTDPDAADKGKWFPFDGAEFKIAAHGTPTYNRALSKLGKKNQAAIRRDDYKALNAMTTEVMAQVLLLDWKGVKDGDADYPYSQENALFLLQNSMELRQFVEAQAMNAANFVTEKEAADTADLKSVPALESPVGEAPGIPEGPGDGDGANAAGA